MEKEVPVEAKSDLMVVECYGEVEPSVKISQRNGTVFVASVQEVLQF